MSSESEFTLIEADLMFYLVSDAEQDASKELKFCHVKLAELLSTTGTLQWISEKSCMDLPTISFTKKTIFVLEKFEGDIFDHLKKTCALILGPKCILHCLHNETTIPNIPSPIYTVSMYNMIVCASGIARAEKQKIGQLVGYMGGYYIADHLSAATTHLITNTVMSKKYEQAAINGKKILKPSWVHAVWESREHSDVDLASLEHEHRVLPFYSLRFTSSGLPVSKKNQLKTIIEQNGGQYSGVFQVDIIDILIVSRNQTGSDKYKLAVKCKKDCLTPEWVFDSFEKGYALPVESYKINPTKKITKSTPKKGNQPSSDESNFFANCTNISEIPANFTVNETVPTQSIRHRKEGGRRPYQDTLAKIDIQKAKKAGPFLDGCNIFLTGFNLDEKEKLYKILNAGGATRFEEYSDKVSHILIGKPTAAEMNELKEIKEFVLMLNLEWLLESLSKKQPASERKHEFTLQFDSRTSEESVSVPSPATKKDIQSMNVSLRPSFAPRRLYTHDNVAPKNIEHEENNLIAQYLENQPGPIQPAENLSENNNTSHSVQCPFGTSTETQNLTFLRGLSVAISGFVPESTEIVYSRCQYAGATIVPVTCTTSTVDYLIVPADILSLSAVVVKYKNVVNDLWFDEAVELDELIEKRYYHEPIIADENDATLKDIVLVVSRYIGREKVFIQQVGQMLGATIVEDYARAQSPVLICPGPEGDKYKGALKWGLPAVSVTWVMACLEQKKKVPLTPFLIGRTKAPPEELQLVDEISNLSIEKTGQQSVVQLDNKSVPNAIGNICDTTPLTTAKQNDQPNDQPTTSANQNKENKNIFQFNKPAIQCNLITEPRTPPIKNRRITQIMGSSSAQRPPLYTPSPPSPLSPTSAEKEELKRRRFADELDTPHRQIIYSVLKTAYENETPESKRRRKALGTPETPREIPERCTQEYRDEQMRLFEERRVPTLTPQTPTTPLDAHIRNFWKNALGDEYTSPSSTYAKFSEIPDDIPCSTQGKTQDVHVKKLLDFINFREELLNKEIVDQPEIVQPTQAEPLIDVNTEPSDVVGWRDPDDFFQSERFKADHRKNNGRRCFMISNIDPNLKMEIISQIAELNGDVCTHSSYDNTCTHLICEAPNRGEKTYSALAAGLWMLSAKYIKDSAAAGYFLDEELYEWGNSRAEGLPSLDAASKSIAKAAHRWRETLQQKSENAGRKIGAFTDFRVILHVARKDLLKVLVEAGCGVVLNVCEPYASSAEALTATHCIVEVKSCQLSKNDRKMLTDSNVYCVNHLFLQAYLTEELIPDPRKFLLK